MKFPANSLPLGRAGILAAAMLLFSAFPGLATEWTREDVDDVVAKVKAGRSVDAGKDYPLDQTQSVWFSTPSAQYLIDIKAKLCFVRGTGGVTPVPCRSLKEGYPLMAPIINWEK